MPPKNPPKGTKPQAHKKKQTKSTDPYKEVIVNEDNTPFSVFFTDKLQWRMELVPEDWKILKDYGLDNYVCNLTMDYNKPLVT